MRQAVVTLLLFLIASSGSFAQSIGDHAVSTDGSGKLLPWYSPDPATSYDHCIQKVWDFWNTIDLCCGGVPAYMIYRTHDRRDIGIGGDQFAMALSSWSALYAYSGDESIKQNMTYIADTYLAHSLSPANAAWPNIPYPCNLAESAIYDGDLLAGKDITQPDKAASFGWQLLTLYKITGNSAYQDAAQKIAATLASHILPINDSALSPLPFRVNAINGLYPANVYYRTTTNWTWAMMLLDHFHYHAASDDLMHWLLTVPVQRLSYWGPFYEDIQVYSNTQINMTAFVRYILSHPDRDTNWREHARAILDATSARFVDSTWSTYGVYAIREQDEYMVPGNSHTADHASAELEYAERTGDSTYVDRAIRQLNWATYWVDDQGRNRYPNDAIWLTDGYGDYVRYYLYAMASRPELAPIDKPHILRSSSVVSHVEYQGNELIYSTFDSNTEELIRMPRKPLRVTSSNATFAYTDWNAQLGANEWSWQDLKNGGVIKVHKSGAREVTVVPGANAVSPSRNELVDVQYNSGSIAITCAEMAFDELVIRNTAGQEIVSYHLPNMQANFARRVDLRPGCYFLMLRHAERSIRVKLVVP